MKVEMSQVNILEKTDYTFHTSSEGKKNVWHTLNITSSTEQFSANTCMYTFLIDHLDIKLNYMIFTYQLIIKVNYSQYFKWPISLSFSMN